MTVIPLFENSHIEIDGGLVLSATITDANGIRPDLTNIGRYHYYVDVVEADGGRIGMWSGQSYDEAVREANTLSKDFGPVRNRVVGGAHD